MSRTKRALTDEERAARRAAEREKVGAAIDQLKTSEGWQRWLGLRRHFHSYSLRNQLLIALQCAEATYVTGFRKWLAIGYAVRKGERAIRIWAPCPPSKAKLRQWRREGGDPASKPTTFFRLVSVFDRSQVEPLPDFPGGPAQLEPPIEPVEGDGLAPLFEPVAELCAVIGFPVTVQVLPGREQGYLDPKAREIVVDELGEDFTPNEQVATLIHECSHGLVRSDRRDEDPKLSYAEGEVVAECVAYTVCSAVGLDTTGRSIPYLASWGSGDDVERYATLIDRLARRIEDVALAAMSVEAAETVAVPAN